MFNLLQRIHLNRAPLLRKHVEIQLEWRFGCRRLKIFGHSILEKIELPSSYASESIKPMLNPCYTWGWELGLASHLSFATALRDFFWGTFETSHLTSIVQLL